jgi:hypothetical protein
MNVVSLMRRMAETYVGVLGNELPHDINLFEGISVLMELRLRAESRTMGATNLTIQVASIKSFPSSSGFAHPTYADLNSYTFSAQSHKTNLQTRTRRNLQRVLSSTLGYPHVRSWATRGRPPKHCSQTLHEQVWANLYDVVLFEFKP